MSTPRIHKLIKYKPIKEIEPPKECPALPKTQYRRLINTRLRHYPQIDKDQIDLKEYYKVRLGK